MYVSRRIIDYGLIWIYKGREFTYIVHNVKIVPAFKIIKKTYFCFYYLETPLKHEIKVRSNSVLDKKCITNLVIKRHQESRNFVLPLFLASFNILFEAVVHDTQKKMSRTNGKYLFLYLIFRSISWMTELISISGWFKTYLIDL